MNFTAFQPPGQPSSNLRIEIDAVAPLDFVSLCWSVFFESRGRGISMATHFPWLRRQGEAFFVTLRKGSDVIGGCAVKFTMDSTRQHRGGIVGLVCVDPQHRGKGNSTAVLEHAIGHAHAAGLSDLILWTGKPGVYLRHGFESDDPGVYGLVQAPSPRSADSAPAVHAVWPDARERRGLPPFASRGVLWKSAAASAIVLHDESGAILAEWEGRHVDVADLLKRAMPVSWRINAIKSDPLLSTLAEQSYIADLKPSNLRMIRRLGAASGPKQEYDLRVLDRI